MGSARDEALRRRRRDERAPGATGAEPDRPQPAEQVLALQRSAGNQAVSALLARSPDTAVPADDKGAKASGHTATLPGIGTIPLLSVSMEPGRRAGRPGGRGGKDEETPKEIVVTSRLGPHSSKLSKAALDGNAMDVEIVMPGGKRTHRLTLKGAIVSGYSTTGGDDPIETWTLNFSAMTHTVDGESIEPDGGGRGSGSDEEKPTG